MEQIRRIRHMEQLLDLALENTSKLSMSQEDYHKTKKIIDDIITTSSTVNEMRKTLNTDNLIIFTTSMTEVYL